LTVFLPGCHDLRRVKPPLVPLMFGDRGSLESLGIEAECICGEMDMPSPVGIIGLLGDGDLDGILCGPPMMCEGDAGVVKPRRIPRP
jgi:hypothetical protein